MVLAKVLNKQLDDFEIQKALGINFELGNHMIEMRLLLSKETGLNQDEIGQLSLMRFFELISYLQIDSGSCY